MRRQYRNEQSVPRQAAPRNPDPRANQKERTRLALITAATELVRRGIQPTVAEASAAAKVSRATAYRYFPTQEALLVDVTQVNPIVAPVEAALAELPAGDPETRLLFLLDAFNPAIFANEAPMRTSVRVYLDSWFEARRANRERPVIREGRRRRWLDQVLEPVRRQMPEREWRRLRAALSLTLGSEALMVMKDVCRLDDREALEVLRWAAVALLRAGVNHAEILPHGRGRKRAARAA